MGRFYFTPRYPSFITAALMPAADSTLIGSTARLHRRGRASCLALLAALLAGPLQATAVDALSLSATPAASAMLRVHAISFSGNTVFSTRRLMAVANTYQDRDLRDADLQDLLRRLTDVYVQAGFSTSRATLPDQDARDGVLHITIIEGFLEQIVISGNHALDPGEIAARLQIGLTTPLNLAVLNANLRLLMQEHGVANIHAELKPGKRRGGALLQVAVEESARFSLGARVANDRAPAVGGTRGAIEGSAHDVFGHGDTIDLALGYAGGLDDVDFRISVPWSARGPELSLRYFRAVSELVEEQFKVLGAETKSHALDVGLTQEVWHDNYRQIKLGANLLSKQSASTLNGVPSSFSPGVEHGKADVKLVRLSAQWQERHAQDSLSARLAWSFGLGVLGATEHDDGQPDSRFHSAYLQLQWLHTWGPRAGLIYARGDAQLASDGLLPLEKFSLGGANSVRGYRRSRFVRDDGWSASLEYRLPIFTLPLPGLSKRGPDGQVALVLFIDAGRAWNEYHDRIDTLDPPTTLLAAGPGLRWDIGADTRAEIAWGAIRRHVVDTQHDLQDLGLHFMISAHQSF